MLLSEFAKGLAIGTIVQLLGLSAPAISQRLVVPAEKVTKAGQNLKARGAYDLVQQQRD